MSDVEIETRENALWIRLNRPERRNAFDTAMANTIVEAFDGAAGARSVVITGNGGSFCAGGSLTDLAVPTTGQMRALYHSSVRLFDAIRNCPRPVIAAVHGPAAGGGNELLIACDFAIATRSATFGQTGPRVGSAPVTGATNVLAVQLGRSGRRRWRSCAGATRPSRRWSGGWSTRWSRTTSSSPRRCLVRGDSEAEPALPGDHEDQLERLVELGARLVPAGHRHAHAGGRQPGHA